jgi:hypothetical protein
MQRQAHTHLMLHACAALACRCLQQLTDPHDTTRATRAVSSHAQLLSRGGTQCRQAYRFSPKVVWIDTCEQLMRWSVRNRCSHVCAIGVMMAAQLMQPR